MYKEKGANWDIFTLLVRNQDRLMDKFFKFQNGLWFRVFRVQTSDSEFRVWDHKH